MRTETGALVTALRKPNARGQWGQMQLRNVVELAGMMRHCDFAEQSPLSSDDAVLRPDLIVNMPGGKHVVVDAKAPLQGVLDAYQARDEEERQGHLRDHARLLRKHVKALADKAYWAELDSAPDFVVMFLPGEHLYGAALEADPKLIEDAMARRVLIATPTTLLAMLRRVAYGWQQERVAESAQAISELGRELHGRLVKLSSLLSTLGTRLNSTVRAYNEAVGSYEARVLPGARRFADHGAVAAGRRAARARAGHDQRPQVQARLLPTSADNRRARPPSGCRSCRGLTAAESSPPEHARPPPARSSRWWGSGSADGLRDCTRASASSISMPSRSATTPAATAAERCQPARQCT